MRRTKAAYHRLAQPGQRVVLALPMNAALGGDGDIRSSAQGKASGRSGSGPGVGMDEPDGGFGVRARL